MSLVPDFLMPFNAPYLNGHFQRIGGDGQRKTPGTRI